MSTKREQKKKAEKKRNNLNKNSQSKEISEKEFHKRIKELFEPLKLTTPTEINDDIMVFCKQISNLEPFFLTLEPEPWSRQSCCDLNVLEYIKLNEGKIICGYKIWYNKPKYIEAERHAVWYKDGIYKDITFSQDGENTILFIPDSIEKQNTLEANKTKIRWGKDSKTRQVIKKYEIIEATIPIQQYNNEDAWNTMLTYEQWLQGERMSNFHLSNE